MFDTLASTINELEQELLSRAGGGAKLFIAMYQHLYNISLYRKQRPLSPPTFSEVLQMRRRTQATDPRDKVFSILGVCKDDHTSAFPAPPPSSKEVEIDYTRSVADVYKGSAKHLIKHNLNLDVLSACQNPQRLNGIPSWAPDWSVPRNNNPIMDFDTWGHIHYASGVALYIDGLFKPLSSAFADANRNLQNSATTDDNGGSGDEDNAIVVRGVALTTIAGIGVPYLGSPDELDEILGTWQHLSLATSRCRPDGTPGKAGDAIPQDGSFLYVTGETVKEAFRMTTTVGRVPPPDPRQLGLGSDSSSDEPDNENASGGSNAEEIDAGAILRYQEAYKARQKQAFTLATENRRFFVTDNGVLMGLGPSEARLDDVVALLCGAHTATILRRIAGEDEVEREEYVVVGEAYVHGVMNGEAFKDGIKEELTEMLEKDLAIRNFTLR